MLKPALGERAIGTPLREAVRERHVIYECQRAGPRAALATIDGDEVHAASTRLHEPREVIPEAGHADRRLDAHRQPRGLGDALHRIQHSVGIMEVGIHRWAHAVHARRHTADACDLGGHLARGQHAAEPGLGPLAQLQLDRPHGMALDAL